MLALFQRAVVVLPVRPPLAYDWRVGAEQLGQAVAGGHAIQVQQELEPGGEGTEGVGGSGGSGVGRGRCLAGREQEKTGKGGRRDEPCRGKGGGLGCSIGLRAAR